MTKSIKINNKEIELKYGMEFVRKLDEYAGEKVPGTSQGVAMGLGYTVTRLLLGELTPEYTYYDIIKAATVTNPVPPSDEDIEDFVLDEIYKDDQTVEKYKNDFLKSFENSKACQRQMKKFELATAEEQAEAVKEDQKTK